MESTSLRIKDSHWGLSWLRPTAPLSFVNAKQEAKWSYPAARKSLTFSSFFNYLLLDSDLDPDLGTITFFTSPTRNVHLYTVKTYITALSLASSPIVTIFYIFRWIV